MTTWLLVLILNGSSLMNAGHFVDPDACKEAGEIWETSRPTSRAYECIPVTVRLP